MQKIRNTTDSYGMALASSRAHEPKYARRSNFMRASPDKNDPSYRHGNTCQCYDRLNFRRRVFTPASATEIRAARKRFETTGEHDTRIARAITKAHRARMAQLLWYIREVCPIAGPKTALP